MPFVDRAGRKWGWAAWALVACACGGSTPNPAAMTPPREKVPAPEWVYRLPREKGEVCATGAVDPTFYRQDGRTSAAESARNELARTIQVKITSVMYDENTTSGSYVDQAFVTEVVGSISEVVLSGAEVRSYWFDEDGSVSRTGMTYALACMPTDASVSQLAERLKEAHPEDAQKIEAVRDRARAAFEELEGMENRAQGPASKGGARTSTAAR